MDDIEMIKKSKAYVAIVSPSFLEDPRTAMQLGFAIFFDKPIYILAVMGAKLPKSLVRAATCIETLSTNNKEEMQRAAKAFTEKIGELKLVIYSDDEEETCS